MHRNNKYKHKYLEKKKKATTTKTSTLNQQNKKINQTKKDGGEVQNQRRTRRGKSTVPSGGMCPWPTTAKITLEIAFPHLPRLIYIYM